MNAKHLPPDFGSNDLLKVTDDIHVLFVQPVYVGDVVLSMLLNDTHGACDSLAGLTEVTTVFSLVNLT